MKRFFLSIFVCMLLFSGVCAQKTVAPVSLVPEKSIAVVRVDWTQVRRNEKLKRVVKGENFPALASANGVSEAKVTEWVVFSDVNPSSSRGLGIIIAGNFTAQSIAQFAKSKDWKSEKIGTGTAYVNPSDNSYLLPLRNGLVVAGTKTGVEKVQSVLSKQTAALITKAPFNAMWTELRAGRQPIDFMVGVPQEYQKVGEIAYKIAAKLMNLASFGILGTVMETIGFVKCFGFNVSHKESLYPTQIFAMMDSETKAWIASGALNMLKKAPGAMGTKPRNEEERKGFEALQTMLASYKGDILSVKINMPESAMPQK